MREPPRSTARRVPRAADGARAHEIGEGVWALQLPVCYESVASVNAYLLRCGEGWIMVDCGSCLAPGWDAVAVALRAAGATAGELAMLVVTHSHTDHRGGAAAVVAHSGCALALGPGPHPMIDVLRDPSTPLETRRAIGRREGIEPIALDVLVDELPGGERPYPPAEPDVTLAIGDTLATISGTW